MWRPLALSLSLPRGTVHGPPPVHVLSGARALVFYR
jgi:hypothetical protein